MTDRHTLHRSNVHQELYTERADTQVVTSWLLGVAAFKLFVCFSQPWVACDKAQQKTWWCSDPQQPESKLWNVHSFCTKLLDVLAYAQMFMHLAVEHLPKETPSVASGELVLWVMLSQSGHGSSTARQVVKGILEGRCSVCGFCLSFLKSTALSQERGAEETATCPEWGQA